MTAPPREARTARRPTAYRDRVLDELERILASTPQARIALDFGAGDGWFSLQLQRAGIARAIVPIDVKLWPGSLRPTLPFDGVRLPFTDRAFDLVFAVDVLHHCADPQQALDEILRCTGQYLLLKDHTYSHMVDRWLLAVLDELGNRRFAVPSPHHYQQRWAWCDYIQAQGFHLEALSHPLRCHIGPLGWATNRLQFAGLWRRGE